MHLQVVSAILLVKRFLMYGGLIMRKITIKDVAKHAGVSIGTVSKVMNNKGYASSKTREIVLKAVDELSYKVNAHARDLKSSKSNRVGVIISDISNPYLMSIAKSVEEMLRTINYHMILMSHNEDEQIERESMQILLEQQVDALVTIPTGENADMVKMFLDRAIPVIAVDRKVETIETDLIVDDNYYGSYESIMYLRSIGHERIGVLYGHEKNSIGRERYQGAVDAIKEDGGSIDYSLIKQANFLEEDAYQATTEMILSPKPPTAIYSCNNTMTIGMLRAIYDQNLNFPNDISVIAFGDSAQWKLVKPSLTIMTQPLKRIGNEASIMLKNRLLADENYPIKQIVIKPKLTVNDSCKRLNKK